GSLIVSGPLPCAQPATTLLPFAASIACGSVQPGPTSIVVARTAPEVANAAMIAAARRANRGMRAVSMFSPPGTVMAVEVTPAAAGKRGESTTLQTSGCYQSADTLDVAIHGAIAMHEGNRLADLRECDAYRLAG